jgi:hypothetical protein
VDEASAFAGDSFWADNDGFGNSLVISSAKFTDPTTNAPFSDKLAPLIITDYGFVQEPGGTGICVAIFDVTVAPVDGSDMFPVDPALPRPKRIIPLTGGNAYLASLNAPWQKFFNGFVAIASTSYSKVTYASASSFLSVRYWQAYIGGMAYQRV